MRDKRWYLWIPALCIFLLLPCIVFQLTSDNRNAALIVTCAAGIFGAAYIGPCFAVLYSLVDTRMRAVSSALFFLCLNIMGLGIGVPIVGVISDALTDTYGQEAIRYALLYVIKPGCLLACLHLLMASRYVREEVAIAEHNAN